MPPFSISFIYTHTPTTEIYTLSLHDALPISCIPELICKTGVRPGRSARCYYAIWMDRNSRKCRRRQEAASQRSEEHTSELQSRENLVCRLLLEKKKKKN